MVLRSGASAPLTACRAADMVLSGRKKGDTDFLYRLRRCGSVRRWGNPSSSTIGGPALTDLIAEQVRLMFTVTGSVSQYIKTGRLKALAVSSAQRGRSEREIRRSLSKDSRQFAGAVPGGDQG